MEIIRFSNRSIVVADNAMENTIARALRAASSESPVLLVGESGTGKELIARFIHEKGIRSKHKFVSVNCAALPEGLIEAELFGFEKGAFTGALQQRVGKFELANRGTLLLDEISEMPTTLQAKLLRVLQENEIDRLGGRDTIPINTRVIATTNRDPISLIEKGLFREDLFYRLNVIRIECAPLRGRESAIRTFSETFLKDTAESQGRGKMRFHPRAMDRLLSHSWPGNIRELKNAIERAVLLSDGPEIQDRHLEGLRLLRKGHAESSLEKLADLEQAHILSTLEKTSGNRTLAADALGISVRTLRNKLKEYSVD